MAEIKHFETIVHIDYCRSLPGFEGTSPEDPLFLEREEKRFQRLQSLSSPENALLYYSAYRLGIRPFKVSFRNPEADNQAYALDEERIKKYQHIFGNRFFLLPGNRSLSPDDAELLLRSRNTTYNPNTTTMTTYGEYLGGGCVDVYSYSTTRALKLNPENTSIERDLCLLS